MKFYNNNIEALQLLRPELYHKVQNHVNKFDENKKGIDTTQIHLQKSKDGNGIIVIEQMGLSYRLNSLYDVKYEVETWASGININGINKVISVFGLGNGMYIRKLLEMIDEMDIVVIYEPSLMIFQFVIESFEIRDLLKNNVYIFIGDEDWGKFRKCLTHYVYWNNLKSQRVFVLPQYERMFEKEMENFLDIIRENGNRTILIQNTNAYFGKIAIENIFSNLKYLDKCNIINDYINIFPNNVPAIIVAAGPSLSKNIMNLKYAKNRAVIFGVDRALEYLYKEGIEPDYAVTIDPSKPAKLFAENYDVTVPLFAELHSHSKLLDVHKGKKVFYDAYGYIDDILNKLGKGIDTEYQYGQSVATAAFSLCIKMGFKTIILIGQDLAYANDGRTTHAGNIVQMEPNEDDMWVEGVEENLVRTRFDWYEFLIWFGDKIEECKDKDINFIDATEGGAKIKGTQIMTLMDAIEKYCSVEIDVGDIEKNLENTYNKKDLKKIEQYIEKGIRDLEGVKAKALYTINDCKKMINKCKKRTDTDKTGKQLTRRIMKTNEILSKKEIFNLINSYITEASKNTMREIYQISEDEESNKLSSFQQAKELYELIAEATDAVKDIINNNYKRWSVEIEK